MGKVLSVCEFKVNYYFSPPCYIVQTNKAHLFLLFTGRHILMLTTASCIQPWRDGEWTVQSYRNELQLQKVHSNTSGIAREIFRSREQYWQKIMQHTTLMMMMINRLLSTESTHQ